MKFAVIENNIVTNVVAANEKLSDNWIATEVAAIGDIWDGQNFSTPVSPPEPLPSLKTQALQAIDQQHQEALLALTGNPTQAEQTTWAGKVALAEAIQKGAPLSAAQSGFLAAMGIPAEGYAQYAQTVLTKSALYWMLVGMADKVRSDCKARVTSAQTHADLEQASLANAAQRDQTMAALAARQA